MGQIWIIRKQADAWLLLASLACQSLLTELEKWRAVKTLKINNQRCSAASQLDCDEDSPNFDEDGRDEYNEIHMLV